MIYYAGVYRIALRIKKELTLAQGESQLYLCALEELFFYAVKQRQSIVANSQIVQARWIFVI